MNPKPQRPSLLLAIGYAAAIGITQILTISTTFAETDSTSSSQVQLNASRKFSDDGWLWGLECAGRTLAARDIPEGGLYDQDIRTLSSRLRFGRVPDPDDSKRTVLQFTASRSDPWIWGAPRCEVTFSPTKAGGLSSGADFWFGVGIYLPKWKITPDEQVIVQWHVTDGDAVFSPFFAVAIVGDAIRFQSQYNLEGTRQRQAFRKAVDLKSIGLPIDKWTYIVTHARISPTLTGGGFLDIWRDGRKIVSYEGPLGYPASGKSFLKFGHYHWVHLSNPWPETIDERTILFRSPTLFFDNGDAKTAQTVERIIRDH